MHMNTERDSVRVQHEYSHQQLSIADCVQWNEVINADWNVRKWNTCFDRACYLVNFEPHDGHILMDVWGVMKDVCVWISNRTFIWIFYHNFQRFCPWYSSQSQINNQCCPLSPVPSPKLAVHAPGYQHKVLYVLIRIPFQLVIHDWNRHLEWYALCAHVPLTMDNSGWLCR